MIIIHLLSFCLFLPIYTLPLHWIRVLYKLTFSKHSFKSFLFPITPTGVGSSYKYWCCSIGTQYRCEQDTGYLCVSVTIWVKAVTLIFHHRRLMRLNCLPKALNFWIDECSGLPLYMLYVLLLLLSTFGFCLSAGWPSSWKWPDGQKWLYPVTFAPGKRN